MIEQRRQNQIEKEEQDQDIVRLVRPEGTYTIMYGIHTVVQPARQLPDKLDGIFLETGGNNYIEKPLETIQNFKDGSLFSPATFRPVVQYTEIFKSLEERQIPIYFADLYLTDLNSANLILAGLAGITGVEGVLGAFLTKDLLETRHHHVRRSLLKGLGALWGLSGIASILPLSSFLTEPFRAIHPEVTTLLQLGGEKQDFLVNTLRDVSIAHKLGWLMQTLGSSPDLGIVIGKGHRDTEGQMRLEGRIMQPAQERLEYLNSVKGALPPSVLSQSLYQVIECRFNGRDWQVANTHEIPELKSLVAG